MFVVLWLTGITKASTPAHTAHWSTCFVPCCRPCWTKQHSSSSNGQQQQQVQPVLQQGLQQQVQQPIQQQEQVVPLYLQPLEDSLVQRLQRYGTFSRLKQVSPVC
jgi:hypothetical protein